jgi:polyisoprenoid-binding protein YceI
MGLASMVFAMGFAACAQSATVEPVAEAPEVAVGEPTNAREAEGSSNAAGAEVEIPAPTQESQVELNEPTQELQVEEPPLAEGEVIFTLDPELTEARFIIGEILANSPNTVVGVNKQVQGGGVLNFVEPELSTLNEFLIDTSGFVTDSTNRNRAIRLFILQSSQHPVISFQPTGIVGIPSEIVVGETLPFEIVGLLTIREVTQEVTFSGEATMVAEDRVEGQATSTVNRSDFGLTIPSVPRVAGVDEQVILEIEFVANAG